MKTISVLAPIIAIAIVGTAYSQSAKEQRLPVRFAGGYETDRRDNGRPVVLIAAALGFKTQVFRDAFSKVHPASNGRPSGDEQRQNKAVLLEALGQYGITNERLDEVSDHYRYRPQNGEMWPTKPAKAFAIVKDGKIVRFEIEDPGYGYSSTPKVSIPGMNGVKVAATLAFGVDFKKNGSIKSVFRAPVR